MPASIHLLLLACTGEHIESAPPADSALVETTTRGDTGTPPGAEDTGAPDVTDTSETDDTGHPDTGDSSTETDFPAPVLDDCVTDGSAGQHTFSCSGFDFDVRLPPQCLDQPCGLVFDVHGMTMSAEMQEANTDMRGLGETHGYVVVQPNANPSPPTSSWSADDDEAVHDFMQRIIAAFHLDEDRVHITGFSQGGWMSWRFVCAYADELASAAPAAACGGSVDIDCSFEGGDAPAMELPLLYMHGYEDTIVDYDCTSNRIEAIDDAWGLSSETVLSEDDDHRWTRWTTASGTPVELIEHDYEADSFVLGGHCYPGSTDPGDASGQLFSFACEGATAFDWGEAVMDFFVAHPRK